MNHRTYVTCFGISIANTFFLLHLVPVFPRLSIYLSLNFFVPANEYWTCTHTHTLIRDKLYQWLFWYCVCVSLSAISNWISSTNFQYIQIGSNKSITWHILKNWRRKKIYMKMLILKLTVICMWRVIDFFPNLNAFRSQSPSHTRTHTKP